MRVVVTNQRSKYTLSLNMQNTFNLAALLVLWEVATRPTLGYVPYGILAGVKQNSAFIAGTWGADFVDGMKPMAGDLVVKGKSGLCGFASTNLDFLLRQNSIENVILGGFLTNCCVESTMRTAYEYGYKVYTLTDCVAATSIAAQDATMQYNFGMFSMPTTSSAVRRAIQASPIQIAN